MGTQSLAHGSVCAQQDAPLLGSCLMIVIQLKRVLMMTYTLNPVFIDTGKSETFP